MRTFVAIFPPPEVREALLRAARDLTVRGEVRWMKPENVHLTLKFLGEVPEDSLDGIGAALLGVAGRHEAFRVEARGFGAFPSAKRARVLWAGVDEGAAALRALAADVEGALGSLGFEREDQAYTPHVTLGRARGRPVALTPADGTPPGPSFVVRRLELVRSAPGERGVGYSTLAAYGLSEG